MTNDFSNIPAESNLRDEITIRSDEYDPTANPAYDGPMGVMTDYDGCDSDDTGVGEDEGDNDDFEDANDRERDSMEPDESMDGDFDSGMASAGLGTAEDYGDYGGNDEY